MVEDSRGLLNDEETCDLIKRAQNGDMAARERLVEANLRLVASIAQRFIGRGCEYEDLFQVGCIGLLKSIAKFDFGYNVKFSTYAVAMIIGEIRRFLRDDSPVRVSRTLKETVARINGARETLTATLGREPTVSEIGAALGLRVENVVAALDAAQVPASLQDEVCGEGLDAVSREDRVAGVGDGENSWLRSIAVRDLLARLPARDRQVLVWRFFDELTQAEIAAELGISQAQVSRIERQALEKLKDTAGLEDLP
ncbi:MAG: SigB/SigF/SigG family RNA polymerase sigma factor [Firmicutes bacterium]|nr:SigB/SigF/SigG family RNA polymerase sigma factor [Bacillota bacterium]